LVGDFSSLNSTNCEKILRDLMIETLKGICNRETDVLDIGAHNIYVAKHLSYKSITLVDLRFHEVDPNLENVKYVNEEIYRFLKTNKKKFDVAILSLFIEHIHSPYALLNVLYEHLNKDGKIFIRYPNARSVNRLVGAEIGMINTPYTLSEADKKVGHLYMYDWDFVEEIEWKTDRRYKLIEAGGNLFKPLPLAIMDKYFGDKMDIFIKIGKELHPKICAEIWCIIKKNEK